MRERERERERIKYNKKLQKLAIVPSYILGWYYSISVKFFTIGRLGNGIFLGALILKYTLIYHISCRVLML